jgi:hypothetical protein
MEIFLLLLFGCGVLFFFMRPKAKMTSSNPRKKAPASSNTIERKWETVDFKWGKETRPDGWVALKGASDVKIAATNKYSGIEFVRQLKPKESTLELVREPTNPVDENAIAVFGKPNSNAVRLHIGYLPSDLAGDIAAEYSSDLPMEPELRRVGIIEGENACFMAINVIVPSAQERKKYLLK